VSDAVVFFFPNGNTAYCDDGEQVPRLQKSWLLLYVDYAVANGVDPTTVEFNLPMGGKARVFKTDEGDWNWRME
jgi:hypothetical protein